MSVCVFVIYAFEGPLTYAYEIWYVVSTGPICGFEHIDGDIAIDEILL